MLRRIDITIDCNDVVPMAKFWAEALGYEALGKFEQYGCSAHPKASQGRKSSYRRCQRRKW